LGWQIIQLEATQGLGSWNEEWDRLNQRLYDGHPFCDSRFVDALLRHFATGSEQLCVHRTAEQIDGLLIMYLRRTGVWTQFVPDQAQSAPILLDDISMLEELFPVLPGHARSFEFLRQDPNFAPPTLLEQKQRMRLIAHNLTMNVALDGTFDEYWKKRSKNLVRNIRRYENRIHDEFDSTELRILTASEDMHDAVTRYGEMESQGWKAQAGTAVDIDNVQGKFYLEVMTRFAATGQARIAEYWLGGEIASSRLILCNSDLSIILKTSYKESLAKFAPGRLLLRNFIRHAFAEKHCSVVEFYTDATSDQLAWATGQRHITHVMFFRSVFQAQLHDTYQSLKHWAAALRTRKNSAALPELATDATCYNSMSELPAGCDMLFQAASRDSFDLSANWFRLLENKALSPNKQLRIYVFKQQDEVRGIFPLLLEKKKIWSSQISGLTNYYSSLYRPLLEPAVTADELAGYLRLILRETDVDRIRFDAMDIAHPTYALLESAMRLAGLRPHRFACFSNWHLPVANLTSQAYFLGLPSQVRNTVRRREKKFYAAGRGTLEIVSGVDRLEEAIAAWGKIYNASWKTAEPFQEFVPELMRMCAARGWLRFGLASYDGEPVAGQIWIVSHGRAAIYKLAYDKKFAHLSVGTVLTAHLMRHVLDEDKVQEVDYLIGDDTYKKDWMSHRRERWGLVAYNTRKFSGTAGAAIQTLGEIGRRISAGKSAPASGKNASMPE
jgi:CelD/BcsL family acetyltransferase involved in cellulose biosynthesis